MLAMLIPSKIAVGDKLMVEGTLHEVTRIDVKRDPRTSKRKNGSPRLGTVRKVTLHFDGRKRTLSRLQRVLVQRSEPALT
jgi:hypothetical protein